MRYPSDSYAFRLNTSPDDAPYKELVDAALKPQQGEGTNRSDALRAMIKDLIDYRMGWNEYAPTQVGEDAVAQVMLEDTLAQLREQLEQSLMQRLTGWLRSRLADARFVTQVNDTHERLVDGDAVEDDILANMLEDLGR